MRTNYSKKTRNLEFAMRKSSQPCVLQMTGKSSDLRVASSPASLIPKISQCEIQWVWSQRADELLAVV